MSKDEPFGYYMEPEDFQVLKSINMRLFQLQDRPFKVDESRDLANKMAVVLNGIEIINEL
jgi:hypothetical protein